MNEVFVLGLKGLDSGVTHSRRREERSREWILCIVGSVDVLMVAISTRSR